MEPSQRVTGRAGHYRLENRIVTVAHARPGGSKDHSKVLIAEEKLHNFPYFGVTLQINLVLQ